LTVYSVCFFVFSKVFGKPKPFFQKGFVQYKHTKNAVASFFVHFCVDRNEPKSDFREGRYPFPKRPQPSFAKPPDVYGRFCSRRVFPRRMIPLIFNMILYKVPTYRNVKFLFFLFSKVFWNPKPFLQKGFCRVLRAEP